MSDLNHDLHARAVKALSENEVRKTRLIRCKDCMYWDKSWQTIEGCHYCGMVDKQTEGDFFCGDGERKEE